MAYTKFVVATLFILCEVFTIEAAACDSERARKLWIAKSFFEYYLSLDQGDDNKVGAGRIGYQLFKMAGYQEQKKTGAKFDVPVQTLIDEIDEWRRQKFISEGEANEQKNALYAMQSNHVIKEVLFDRGQFEMVYGLTGYIRLNGKYASVFTFHSFKLSSIGSGHKRRKRYIPPDFAATLAEMQKWKDVDWSSMVGSAMNQFVANQLDNIMAYIRFDALQTFKNENGQFLNDLLQEEKKCEDFLPAGAKSIDLKLALFSRKPK